MAAPPFLPPREQQAEPAPSSLLWGAALIMCGSVLSTSAHAAHALIAFFLFTVGVALILLGVAAPYCPRAARVVGLLLFRDRLLSTAFFFLVSGACIITSGSVDVKSTSANAGHALMGFFLFTLGVALVLLAVAHPHNVKAAWVLDLFLFRDSRLCPAFFFLVCGACAIISGSVEVRSTTNDGHVLMGFLLFNVGVALVLLTVAAPHNPTAGRIADLLLFQDRHLAAAFFCLVWGACIIISGSLDGNNSTNSGHVLMGFLLFMVGAALIPFSIAGPYIVLPESGRIERAANGIETDLWEPSSPRPRGGCFC